MGSAGMGIIEQEPHLHGAMFGLVLVLLGVAILDAWLARTGRSLPQHRIMTLTIFVLWSLTAVVTWGWLASGRSWAELGFIMPTGWPGVLAWVFGGLMTLYLVAVTVLLANSPQQRAETARDVAGTGDLASLAPQSLSQLALFQVLAVTAGITEEILFRGFAITVAALWLPYWAAGLAALVLFILSHFYQGPAGMLRLIPISIILTIMYMTTGSLIPGIILHILVDVFGGLQLYLLRKESVDGPAT